MTFSAELSKTLGDLELFTELVRNQVNRSDIDFERLLDGYLEARHSLAKQFCLVAQGYLLRNDSILETTRKLIEERMAQMFRGRIPDKYLLVRGYKSMQPILLQYLAQHAGNPVRSSKLRVLTADQIHTERRVRDLRELGFEVAWKKTSNEDQYVLRSREPDLSAAAVIQVRKNIKRDKKIPMDQKIKLLRILEK